MRVTFFLLAAFSFTAAAAQVDTIYRLDSKLIKKYLKPSSNQYLIFGQRKDKPGVTFSVLSKSDIRFINRNGQELIEIVAKSYNADTTKNRTMYSLLRANDFSPVYHYSRFNQKVKAYDFYADKIKGSDSVTNNNSEGFFY